VTLAVIGYQQPLAHPFIQTLVQSTDIVADLFSFIGTAVSSSDTGVTGTAVYTLGQAAAGDGGGGLFYWNAASIAASDGINVVQPATVTGGGRWLRALSAVLVSLVVVTGTGAIPVTSAQRTIVWEPGAPATVTFTLPAAPPVGEMHTFKNRLASSAYAMTVAANGGQTIDGEPYSVLAQFNDRLTVQYAGSGLWVAL